MNIGVIANDGKKNLMQNLCIAYQDILRKHNIFATKTTGRVIEEVTNLKINTLQAGHFGGMQQMGSKISCNEIDVLIFLKDPNLPNRSAEFYDILTLCDRYNTPCATNLPTAEVLILALDRGDLDWRDMYR